MEEKINLIKPERVSLLNHPKLDERWIQQRIADDPSILGLGDLILKDKEKIQPKAGRLDLLLQDSDSVSRYEVEVQLGKVDESHIIRTIEYWDIERRRFPNYQHYAVIIAEDVTNRFLNVISLLNKTIPLIVIKMEANRYQDNYWLNFTVVMNEVRPDTTEEEDVKEATDRGYWEKRGTPDTVVLVDKMLDLIQKFDSEYELKYNKFYIGLAKHDQPDNFVVFRPKKTWTEVDLRLEQSDELDKLMEDSKLSLMDYSSRGGRYRIQIDHSDLINKEEVLSRLLLMASGMSEDTNEPS